MDGGGENTGVLLKEVSSDRVCWSDHEPTGGMAVYLEGGSWGRKVLVTVTPHCPLTIEYTL